MTPIVVAAVLSACASSPDGMRTDVQARRSFVVDVGYQLALKRINDQWASCSAGPLVPLGQVINDVQHYPDLRTATIVRGASGIGTQITQVIDLKEPAPGRTEVTVYAKARADELAARTARIVAGDLSC